VVSVCGRQYLGLADMRMDYEDYLALKAMPGSLVPPDAIWVGPIPVHECELCGHTGLTKKIAYYGEPLHICVGCELALSS
jgi:hypothetical protein